MRVLPTDGYAAMRSLLPPRDGDARIGRGLVLIDPPYETQLAEFDDALAAIREGLRRFPQGVFALWYPIKLRRTLGPFQRRAADLPARSVLVTELLVRPDDSPLRMNGSGLVIVNAPWKLDETLAPALAALASAIGAKGASSRVAWLRGPE
jgi:23S rRNA (adenine2030-N6)-methyltransferase